MKKLLLFALGVALITAGAVRRTVRRRLRGSDLTEGARRSVLAGGLADVDPQPLTTMGEAVDPDGLRRAHTSVRDQRAKLPRL
jgi:hypothetical protein